MLFKKLFVLALLVIATEQLIYYSLVKKYLPLFWGNEDIATKIQYLKKHQAINTIFIGSSKVKTQIKPAVFDSVTNHLTRSFNLGCNGLFIPEAFNVLEYIIDSTNIKTIFFEIRPVYHIYKENLHITRTIYYHTVGSYINTLQNTYQSNIPLVRKVNAYSTFSIAATEKLLNFNLFEGIINYKNFNYKLFDKYYDSNGGCFVMGDEQGDQLKASHKELDERAALSVGYMKRFRTDSLKQLQYNSTYYNKIIAILAKATQKKLRLILLFPPALREFEYKEILPLLRQLSNIPQVILADADIYPELYKPENNFETDHLNAKGAVYYSIDLGKAYKKISGL